MVSIKDIIQKKIFCRKEKMHHTLSFLKLTMLDIYFKHSVCCLLLHLGHCVCVYRPFCKFDLFIFYKT